MKFYEILKNVILEDARIDVLVDKFLKPIKGKESLLNAEELFDYHLDNYSYSAKDSTRDEWVFVR